MYLSCPTCGIEHDAATTWAVRGIRAGKDVIILQLACPSCEFKYPVLYGQIPDAATGLRVNPKNIFRFATLIGYSAIIGAITLLLKLF